MPIIQIDWQEIKEKFGDVTAIYAFTHRQASLLLSLSEQLSWEKTFREFGYDFDDKDDLDWEIDDLRKNLVSPVDLTDIIPYIDEIEDLLRSLQTLGVCCDDVKPISDKYDVQNDDFPDTPPETWGDEEVADSADWIDLVCGAANNYVDLLKDTNNELDRIITAAALGIGAIAGLLTLLSGAGLILAIGYGTAATIVGGLVAGASIGTFTGIDDDLEDGRQDIVCAVLNGGPEDLSNAVEAWVSALAWTLWFQWIDYENAWAVMIDGTNGTDNLRPNRGEGNCDCDLEPGQLVPNPYFEDSASGWNLDAVSGGAAWTYVATPGSPYAPEVDIVNYNTPTTNTGQDLRSASFTLPASVGDLYFDIRHWSEASRGSGPFLRVFRVSDDLQLGATISSFAPGEPNDNSWINRVGGPVDLSSYGGTEVYVTAQMLISGGSLQPKFSYIKLWTYDPSA